MVGFKVGIMGAGYITGVVADTLMKLDGFENYAIASTSEERAKEYKEKYGFEKYYTSYEDLANDDEVEMIYIATVNSNHAELAQMCLNAGKPCLVEKPFSYNAKTAYETLKLAEEKNLFCGEAMWTRYHPLIKNLQDYLKQDKYGEVRYMTANLGYNLMDRPRLLDPKLAGGSLLDLGIYPLSLTFLVMGGLPISIGTSNLKLSTGVDCQQAIQMNFSRGRFANVFSTMMYNSDNTCKIYQATGRIEIDNVNNPSEIKTYGVNGELVETFTRPDNFISGYEYEFLAAREAIIVGKLETPEVPRKYIMDMYKFTDQLRAAWKNVYPLPGEPKLEDLPDARPMENPNKQ